MSDIALVIARIAQRKTNEFFAEAIEVLSSANGAASVSEEVTEPTADGPPHKVLSAANLDFPPPRGSWVELRREPDVTYTWPDGNVDRYEDYVIYRGTGDFDGMQLALGYIREGVHEGDVVGFHLGEGAGSKRGITYFFPADDFDQTNEKVSMIRGGGEHGRSGFAPGAALPRSYGEMSTDVLRARKAGKWNVQAVVADADDHDAMLTHTALQARLRGLS